MATLRSMDIHNSSSTSAFESLSLLSIETKLISSSSSWEASAVTNESDDLSLIMSLRVASSLLFLQRRV